MSAILLVEDDRSLGESLQARLSSGGQFVQWCSTRESATAAALSKPFDLAIIDIGLPDGDGFQVARAIAERQNLPFLFLTAMNDAEFRLRAFELGAVDYIPKPFHLKELLLRVERALKAAESGVRELTVGNMQIDFKIMTISFSDGSVERPAARDFRTLQYLIQQSPRVLSREELASVVGVSEGGSLRGIDNTIVRLRAILRRGGGDHIHSVRGVGYQWLA